MLRRIGHWLRAVRSALVRLAGAFAPPSPALGGRDAVLAGLADRFPGAPAHWLQHIAERAPHLAFAPVQDAALPQPAEGLAADRSQASSAEARAPGPSRQVPRFEASEAGSVHRSRAERGAAPSRQAPERPAPGVPPTPRSAQWFAASLARRTPPSGSGESPPRAIAQWLHKQPAEPAPAATPRPGDAAASRPVAVDPPKPTYWPDHRSPIAQRSFAALTEASRRLPQQGGVEDLLPDVGRQTSFPPAQHRGAASVWPGRRRARVLGVDAGEDHRALPPLASTRVHRAPPPPSRSTIEAAVELPHPWPALPVGPAPAVLPEITPASRLEVLRREQEDDRWSA